MCRLSCEFLLVLRHGRVFAQALLMFQQTVSTQAIRLLLWSVICHSQLHLLTEAASMLSCKPHSHTRSSALYTYSSQVSSALQEQTVACSAQQWAKCFVTSAVFDVRWNSRFGAMLNLVRSTFVIVALGCGAVLFNNDSNRLVLRPIERMLRKVSNPPPALLVEAAGLLHSYCQALTIVLVLMLYTTAVFTARHPTRVHCHHSISAASGKLFFKLRKHQAGVIAT